jgi:hypothetical protein
MRSKTLIVLAVVGMVLAVFVAGASSKGLGTEFQSAMPYFDESSSSAASGLRGARLETLWIFDADFHDLEGDNAGWTSLDRSGTLATENYWHKDTIHMLNLPYLGDSTWWCGTYNECWLQSRGYANSWVMVLERSFPEVDTNTDPGDPLTLEWDQRFAMEHDYDYGYVDVSVDGGGTWATIHTVNNPGFAGKPGFSQEWTNLTYGHVTKDLTSYAGEADFQLRFRFESDEAYSSQDQYNNAPFNTCLDGAWQLDNIKMTGGTPAVEFWLDDTESGNMGWVHDDVVASGQTGVVFERGLFGDDFVTGRPFTCEDRQGWMYAAVEPVFSKMVDGQFSWLMSPPIDISGAPRLVGHWDFWLDMPRNSNDICNLYLASDDLEMCVSDPAGFVDEDPGWWYGDAGWRVRYDDWDAFAGNDWLAVLWAEQNDEDPEPGAEHWAGIIFNRQRVGIPSGDAGTAWETDTWNSFNDWIDTQLADAMLDTARIKIKDDDGIATAYVVASNNGGATWSSYACRREEEGSDWYFAPPPSNEMTPGSVIRYYFEATDEDGNVSTLPSDAPNRWLEMSILPINATLAHPGILLVDKHGRTTPGEARYRVGYNNYRPLLRYHTEFYYKESLEILGYEVEIYDVEVPSGSTDQSNGPDSSGMKYYDTQIWFVNEFNAYTIKAPDQMNLINWLDQSSAGKQRNLLLTGTDIGYELVEVGKETLAFYETWLASEYVDNAVGVVTVDSVPGLEDHVGDFQFMSYDDNECIVRGACPVLVDFDVINARPVVGAEIVADFIKLDGQRRPAGVAYTHPTSGYQTVNLSFGPEFMMDGVYDAGSANYTPEGYYHSGLLDRLDLMQNIMDYFVVTAEGEPTDVVDGGFRNVLQQAVPNPFNPVTKIAYSVKDAGRATIQVYNVAGKVVRALLDTELDAGAAGEVVWDGLNDVGERCASGVYFYRIQAPSFTASRKMVMLK